MGGARPGTTPRQRSENGVDRGADLQNRGKTRSGHPKYGRRAAGEDDAATIVKREKTGGGLQKNGENTMRSSNRSLENCASHNFPVFYAHLTVLVLLGRSLRSHCYRLCIRLTRVKLTLRSCGDRRPEKTECGRPKYGAARPERTTRQRPENGDKQGTDFKKRR